MVYSVTFPSFCVSARSNSKYDSRTAATVTRSDGGPPRPCQRAGGPRNLLAPRLLHWCVKLFELSAHYGILKCIIVRAFMVCHSIHSICPFRLLITVVLSARAHAHTQRHTRSCTYTYTRAAAKPRSCTHTHTHTHTHTKTHTCMHARTHTHRQLPSHAPQPYLWEI